MSNLISLAELIKIKNEVDARVAAIVHKPAIIGNVGEYIAADVFRIRLHTSRTFKGSDGLFEEGRLSGNTVNVKWYSLNTRILDITPNSLPDFYLVLTGPRGSTTSYKGKTLQWVIERVFLFNSQTLIPELQKRNVKIGIATSVVSRIWEECEIYPNNNNKDLILTDEQRGKLNLFK